ncbi:MAG: hypothetical protein HGA53_06555, partial [Anaerolineaceae bacterium]|nr:hypothetical protein [Anaerolineaceae bacterium]
ELSYPLFVKPAREGTGMGMGADSVVHNDDQLRRRVRWVIETYDQPALVEDFLPGREFTIGVVGRADAALYSRRSELYGADGFIHFPTLEIDNHSSVTPGVYGHTAKTLHEGDDGVPGFLCPAPVDARTTEMYHDLAVRAHLALNTVDVSRVDIRLDAQGNPRLLEINTLPGLTPGFSDLCVIANAYGMTYEDLILEILYLGASRYGMLPARGSQPRRIEHRTSLRIERRVHMPQMVNMMPFGHTAMLE